MHLWITFFLGPTIFFTLLQGQILRSYVSATFPGKYSLPLALKSSVKGFQWQPDAQAARLVLASNLTLSCLLCPEDSFKRKAFPDAHNHMQQITAYFVILVALSISHMTNHILVYMTCEVYFLYQTRTSLKAGSVSHAVSSKIKGMMLLIMLLSLFFCNEIHHSLLLVVELILKWLGLTFSSDLYL